MPLGACALAVAVVVTVIAAGIEYEAESSVPAICTGLPDAIMICVGTVEVVMLAAVVVAMASRSLTVRSSSCGTCSCFASAGVRMSAASESLCTVASDTPKKVFRQTSCSDCSGSVSSREEAHVCWRQDVSPERRLELAKWHRPVEGNLSVWAWF